MLRPKTNIAINVSSSDASSRYEEKSDGQLYFFHEEEKNWNDALSICQREMRGASLAIVDQEETLKVVKSYSKKFWLGGTDEKVDGEWLWIQPFRSNQRFSNTTTQFFEWGGPEPNGEERENCLALNYNDGNGGLDAGCTDRQFSFLCQLTKKSKYK